MLSIFSCACWPCRHIFGKVSIHFLCSFLLLGYTLPLHRSFSFCCFPWCAEAFNTDVVPGASTGDPTHDKVMREKIWQARWIRSSGVSKRLAHKIPPMTRSWGKKLTGKADQVFRDPEKLPPALTLKMMSVFLMLASIDYSLISVTQAEGLPHLFPNKNQFRTLINKFPRWWYFMRLSRLKGVF